MSNWNGKRFSVYTSEEKSVLGLIKELGKQTNYNSDALDNKTDINGDHKGTWQGLSKPTLSEEGMRATVEKINEQDIPTINSQIGFLDQLKSRFVYGIKGDGTDETLKIQKYLDSINSGDVAYFPKGTYKFTTLRLKDKQSVTILGATEISDYSGGKNATKFVTLGGNANAIMLDGCVGSVFKNIELTYENYVKGQVDYNGIGLNLEGSPQSRVMNCIIHGFDIAIRMHSVGVMNIEHNRLFNCNTGIYGKECGDSVFLNNYIYDIAMDKPQTWLESNIESGCAMSLAYCGNSIIQGGKIEWNGKGISLVDTHGIVLNAIVFDYNRGFDVRTRRSNDDYIWDKNRPNTHVQMYYKYSSYDNKITNCTFLSSGHFGILESHYGSNIVLYQSSDTVINSNTFSFGSWQSYANQFGDNPLYETGGETIRKKSGPKVSFIKIIDCPNIVINGNSFNTNYVIPPVQIVDSGNIVSSVNYSGNTGYHAFPQSNKNRGQFYQIDSVGRKIFNLDGAPSSVQGSYSYMDTIRYFDGAKLKEVYCTSDGTIKPLADLYVSNDSNTLNALYCQNRDISEQDLVIGDFITVNGEKVRVTGFYKSQYEGNTWIKINKKLSTPVNGKQVTLTYPTFSV